MKPDTRAFLLAISALTACEPDFDLRSSRVESERVIAVIAEPAEARPGETVTYTAVAAGSEGPVGDAVLSAWHCTAPKPLAENNTVSEACATAPGAPLETDGGIARGLLPVDACRLFGPDPPPGDFRPRDPDGTGGYFQPLRLAAFGRSVIHLQRVFCNPGDVAADVARAFSAGYAMNGNPAPVWMEVREAGRLLEPTGDEQGIELDAGATIELTVAWEEAAREAYAFIDRIQQAVIERREALHVDWFCTGEGLGVDRHGVEEGSTATLVTNEFRVPARSGRVHIWAVVHDSRGGTALVHQRFNVR